MSKDFHEMSKAEKVGSIIQDLIYVGPTQRRFLTKEQYHQKQVSGTIFGVARAMKKMQHFNSDDDDDKKKKKMKNRDNPNGNHGAPPPQYPYQGYHPQPYGNAMYPPQQPPFGAPMYPTPGGIPGAQMPPSGILGAPMPSRGRDSAISNRRSEQPNYDPSTGYYAQYPGGPMISHSTSMPQFYFQPHTDVQQTASSPLNYPQPQVVIQPK